MTTEARVARARRRPSADAVVAAGLVVGLVVAVVGTFLPWLHSGAVSRNSYTTDGALKRLLDVDGALGMLLDVWPFLSIACAVAIALVLLRYVWAGAVVAMVASTLAGAVAYVALTSDVHFIVRPAASGPAVTVAGTALVWLAVLFRITRRFR